MSRPVRDLPLIKRLFAERLTAIGDAIDAGYGYEVARLSVLASVPFENRQADLAGDGPSERENLARLADRIHARLGRAAIFQPAATYPNGRAVLSPFPA